MFLVVACHLRAACAWATRAQRGGQRTQPVFAVHAAAWQPPRRTCSSAAPAWGLRHAAVPHAASSMWDAVFVAVVVRGLRLLTAPSPSRRRTRRRWRAMIANMRGVLECWQSVRNECPKSLHGVSGVLERLRNVCVACWVGFVLL